MTCYIIVFVLEVEKMREKIIEERRASHAIQSSIRRCDIEIRFKRDQGSNDVDNVTSQADVKHSPLSK